MTFWRFFLIAIFIGQFALAVSQGVSQDNASNHPIKVKTESNPELSLKLNEEGIVAVKAEKFDQAEKLFNQSLKADSGNITAAFNLAGVLLSNKRNSQAIALLKKYIGIYPKDAGLHVRLADCYFSQKQVDLALSSYEKGFSIDPKYPRLSSKLATVYGLKNRMKDAEKMYRISVETNPKDTGSLENLSVLLIANGKVQEAIPYIKSAIELESSASLYELLGQAYQLLNDNENASIAYGRAKSLGK